MPFQSKKKKFLRYTGTLLLILIFSGCQTEEEEPAFLIGQGIGINSATLLVNDLPSAINYYRDTLGFNIRGEGGLGVFDESISASISFGDMTSFEILSVSDSADQDRVPLFISEYLANDEGVRFYALTSSSVDSTLASLTSRGFIMDSARSYRTSSEPVEGWSWDDGDPQRKSLDFGTAGPSMFHPRFIQSTGTNYDRLLAEWNTYYIYRRMFRNHANGVLGTSAIKIAVQDLNTEAELYEQMGFELIKQTESMVSYSVFRHQELCLVSMDSIQGTDTAAPNRVYAVQFDVLNLDSTFQYLQAELPASALTKMTDRIVIDSEFAYGVQLEFVQEPEEQSILAKTLMPSDELDTLGALHASELYIKYCALCHGENREGYAADNAPSLRSKSLLGTSMNNNFMRYTIQFGRANTAMAGYLDTQGGPMEFIEIELLMEYLQQMAEVDEAIEVSRDPVYGDIELGTQIYANNCASCHGEKGEGISAPALANPMLLATATDHFLRYAIAEGRDGTPMVAFKDQLSDNEINAVTAFLRSRASGWDIPKLDSVKVPTPDEYVLNPDSEAPVFELREGKYVAAEQVNKALVEGKRMVILDARSEVAWRQMHIPGAAPVPYYEEPENFIDNIPNDGTQIVIYCACPHAASERVQNTLKRHGYKNTAIIDEGILVWAQMGFPVQNGS